MARPKRNRQIYSFPDYWIFKTEDNYDNKNTIILGLDEYEVIRLIDYEGLSQEECAEKIGVSRPTVTDIYKEARKKLAIMLVEGATLMISGGAYTVKKENLYEVEKKGKNQMRIALAYDNGNVFQHFGRTKLFKLYDIADGKIVKEEDLDSQGQGHGALANLLKAAQVDGLICGGIGAGARTALAEMGIEIYPGVTGSADEAVEAFIQGNLDYDPDNKCDHHGHHHGHGQPHGERCGHRHGHGNGHSCH